MSYISEFTGIEIDKILKSCQSKRLTDVLTFEEGVYTVPAGANYSEIENISELPKGLKNDKSGFVMIVKKIKDARQIAIIIPNQMGNFYIMIGKDGKWTNRVRYRGVRDDVDTEQSYMGTTAQRPTMASFSLYNDDRSYGRCYIDTTLGKPIWWTGDTSDGKTGWIDANGDSV